MTFPNIFDAAPGTQLNFLSFDHTTGRLVIEGTATVSADGLSVSTDPGTGITHPGWHGLTPPGGPGGPDGPENPADPASCNLPPMEGEPTEPLFELRRVSRGAAGAFVDTPDFLFTSTEGEGLLEFKNLQPTSPCFLSEGELLVDVTVNNANSNQF